jgi:hypothetical protein
MMKICDLKEAQRQHRDKLAVRLYKKIAGDNPNMKVMCVMMAVGRSLRPTCSWLTVRRIILKHESF